MQPAAMIQCKRRHLEARCRERGYTMDEVRACIFAEDGDSITVDETHERYPRPRQPASDVARALNFAKSFTKHVAAGMPQASDDDIARRFAICQQCEHYDGAACDQCGCPIVRKRKFLSKLAWAGESCPSGKW